MKLDFWTNIVALLVNFSAFLDAEKLGAFIRHYEPLNYDHIHLNQQHHRVKRSTAGTLNLDFNAFNRDFELRLKRDEMVLHPNFVVTTSEGEADVPIDRAYKGHLQGQRLETSVVGTLTPDGHFEGKIKLPDEIYFVSHHRQFFKEPPSFHSVIYRQSDVTFKNNGTTCHADKLPKYPRHHDDAEDTDGALKYKPETERLLIRKKRAKVANKKACSLKLEADHKFYNKRGNRLSQTMDYMVQCVQQVNDIIKDVDFDGDGTADDIQLYVKRMHVHTNENTAGYKFKKNKIGVESYLDTFSQEDFADYCLGYIFTDRDFDGGTVGLAWTGSTSNAGGICDKYKNYKGTKKTLNTGLVTDLNFGNEVPQSVTCITLAHEIGHNFGAPHDTDGSSCAPSGSFGNFIMYASATDGTKTNNRKYSSCSENSISPVLDDKAWGPSGCFENHPTNTCGNKIKEVNEQCDCGWDNECNNTGCCNPQKDNPGAATPCQLPSGIACSPDDGPCCGSGCTFEANSLECRPASDCYAAQTCDTGNYQAACPPSSPMTNGTACGSGMVCYNGECTSAAVCFAQGYEDCQCAPTVTADWTDSKLCHVCCMDGGQCKSSYEIAAVANSSRAHGGACMEYKGFCDVFNKCRQVDAEGPLTRLSNMITGISAEGMKAWLTDHWWVVLIAGVGFFVLMAVLIKVCAKKRNQECKLNQVAGRRY